MSATQQLAIIFLGTRGEIDARSRQHLRHSSVMIERGGARVMIDCGADWLGHLMRLSPTAILLTHAHPDHAAGLTGGAPCPIYATRTTWRLLSAWPLCDRRVMPLRKPIAIGGITFEAFPVAHSLRAPAVGYRISVGRSRLFYVPDVVAIRNRRRALEGLNLYVGDGAAINRPIIRRRGQAAIGHTSIRIQLDWCKAERVGISFFTHCGSGIVNGDPRRIGQVVRRLGVERGVEARVARDGLRLVLDGRNVRCAGAARGFGSVNPAHGRC
ncbi:MBL fold metallo-hydrolase [Bradyrhizobium sp. C-145]|uniref:MBL fold metallo-hydrolase n=1 Tax=Bradyrhizobium sp. C-145 TaxID=574727 RepID=UPI00201B7904|nr:MBL fold metallo-hydrolase [Bradyrhizobium sp. C-145]UQR64582.1 MBL fold metallo-hydrolase [Bradyrhizobium sp. C-145]